MGERSRKRALVGVVAVLLLWPVAASTAFASTGTVPGRDRAAAVQAVLDRVLGPGGATVVVTDTVNTSASTTTTQRWGSGVAASVATSRVVAPNGTVTASTQQNLVGGTTTAVATPAGALVGQSVAVAVDRSKLGSTSLATIRRLVVGAAGIVGTRDRVSITVVRFAHPAAAAAAAAAASPLTLLLPYAVPAIWALGAIAALLILVRAVRGPKRRRVPAGP